MNCTFCYREEPGYSPGRDVSAIICSDCTIRLAGASEDALIRTYRLAVEKGYTDKAEALKSFLPNREVIVDGKTYKARSDMDRKRSVRKVKLDRRRKRSKPTVERMGKRRSEA